MNAKHKQPCSQVDWNITIQQLPGRIVINVMAIFIPIVIIELELILVKCHLDTFRQLHMHKFYTPSSICGIT